MSARSMIVYKTWLDTRWRFIIGLFVLLCSAGGAVLLYPQVKELLPLAEGFSGPGALAEEVRKAVELSGTFRGYVWHQWGQQNLAQMGTLFAVLLGAGGVFAQGAGGGGYYTLALPVSRRQLFATRAAAGLGELFVLAMASMLVIPALAPAVGETYPLGDALVFGLSAFVGCSVFFSLTLLLATVFADVWRPVLIGLAVAVLVGIAELVLHDAVPFGVFRTINAETYFQAGAPPWLGLIACAAGSAGLIYAAVLNFERKNF